MSDMLTDDDGNIFQDIAQALLEKLGASIWSQLFPSGENLEQAFADLLAKIETLMFVEAISNDILLIEGLLKGITQQLSIDYANMKAQSGTTKAELVSYLSGLRSNLETGVTGPLQTIIQNEGSNSKSNAQQSMLVFLTGGSTLLSVLQEMALQDPDVTDPINSQYAADLKTYAATLAPVASGLLASIKTSRINAVSGIVTPSGVAAEDVVEPVPPVSTTGEDESDSWPVGTHTCEYQVQDGWTGQVYCDNSEDVSIWQACVTTDAYTNTAICYAVWIGEVGPQFDADWANSSDTIATWNTLSTDPLGPGASLGLEYV